MIERKGNMWDDKDADAIVITTNGFVKNNGEAVMGRGCAKEAAEMFPELLKELGSRLTRYGNKVFAFGFHNFDPFLFTFPVKPSVDICNKDKSNVVQHMRSKFKRGDEIPGWACVADMQIIEQSVSDLSKIVNIFDLERIIMPKIGCGAGELEWKEVKPILEKYLDDRFFVYSY